MNLNDLVAKKVLSASINAEKTLVILQLTQLYPSGAERPIFYYLRWVGDCCAECYLAHVAGVENLVGAVILEVEDAEWEAADESDPDAFDVVESLGTKIKTNKGYVTFESRVEHNGYYGGSITVSDQFDAYMPTVPLEDF